MATTPYPISAETNAAMRVNAGEIKETIARTREVIQQAREAMAKADRLIAGDTSPSKAGASS